MTDQKKPPFWKNLTAGTFGGMALTLVGHPLDTIKVKQKLKIKNLQVRLQTMPKPNPGEKPLYTGALDCAKQCIKKEGPFGLYKGVSSRMSLKTF
jgi:solute carrier family 25 (mitochondrial carnitine/acylcarnitine transporter), member 20/29